MNIRFFLLLLSACCWTNSPAQVTSTSNTLLTHSTAATIPEVVERMNAISTTVKKEYPVLLLQGNDTITTVQKIALGSKEFTQYFTDTKSNNKTLNEVFGVYPLLSSNSKDGKVKSIFRVEMYNYAYNLSTVALVDYSANKVIRVNHYLHTQPDVPKHLGDLALKIALNAPEVKEALGYAPTTTDAQMYYTTTALNRSRCERSRHLCIAPTFVAGQKALWAVVDLTDLKLVGIRWTNLGRDTITAEAVTEKKIQNEYITNCFCLKENTIDRNGWKLNYSITASDGLRISNVGFNNTPVLSSAKLVDWHVSYDNVDGFGYSDAVGCPQFSHGAVLAIEPPVVSDLEIDGKITGFVLEQKFYSKGWPLPCNYNYVQRFEFYDNGNFRVACGSLGRGCGNNGTYRPVMRIGFAANNLNFKEVNEGKETLWQKESWKQITDERTFKLTDRNNTGYSMLPDFGRFGTQGRKDNPFVYVTKDKTNADEGESDLVTIGPCCNNDYRQGPEKFMEPVADNITNTGLVVWYVPVLKNDDTPGKEYCWAKADLVNGTYKTTTYPCIAGPLFIPVKKN